MDMMDKKKKMKALDLMIVLKKDDKAMEDGMDNKEEMDHSDCKCPCCGKQCAYCSEEDSEEYEDSEEE
jgi:hypothetical protein